MIMSYLNRLTRLTRWLCLLVILIAWKIVLCRSKNLSDLANKETGFTVPENYFEEFNSNIQSRIAIERIPNSGNNGFDVPEGYFDNLEQQIKSRILVEAALGDPDEHFSVPQGYFNELNQKYFR